MATFLPSVYSLGAESAEGGKAPTDSAEYSEYVKLAREFFIGDSPAEEAAILQARIQTYKQSMAKTKVGLLRTWYSNEIAKMEARLAVLQQQAGQEKEAADTTQMLRVVGVSVAVLGGLVLAGLAVVQIWKVRKMEAERDVAIAQMRAVSAGRQP